MSRFLLPTVKENPPAVLLRPHRKVNPIGGAALFLDQFVEHQDSYVSPRSSYAYSISDVFLCCCRLQGDVEG